MGGFFDPDYARDKAIADLKRRVSALEQRIADLEPADAAPQSAVTATGRTGVVPGTPKTTSTNSPEDRS